jgi:hypothetical protein
MRRLRKVLASAIVVSTIAGSEAVAQDDDAVALLQKTIELPGEFPLENGGVASISVEVIANAAGDIVSLDYDILERGVASNGGGPKKSCDTCPSKGTHVQFCVIDECPKPGGPRLSVPVLLWAEGGLGEDDLPEVSFNVMQNPLSDDRSLLELPVLDGRDWSSAMSLKE